MNKLKIYFDGGCEPNPGNKYGSYEILVDDKTVIKESRVQFGYGTNNEAEFNALEDALYSTVRYAHNTGLFLTDCTLAIETDSTILRNRLIGRNVIHKKQKWAKSSARMYALAEGVLRYKRLFRSWSVEWSPRINNFNRFGH